MKKEIKHSLSYRQSLAEVWKYLTTAELIKQWLMENNFQPVVGHEFQFKAGAMPDHGFDGIIHCKVLAVEPMKKLTYSWATGPGNGDILLDSVVEFTLREQDGGTELSVSHTGIESPVNTIMFTAMDAGWLKQMKLMATVLDA